MPNVDISINGRIYTVACDDGQQGRIRDLAGIVDTRVRGLVGAAPIPAIGESHVLVLAGLMLADDLDEAQAKMAELQAAALLEAEPVDHEAALEWEDPEILIAAVEHLTERIAVIADRLERA